jgi:hypothetical protein
MSTHFAMNESLGFAENRDIQRLYIRLLRPMLIVGAVVVGGLIVYVLWLSRFIR